MVKHPVSLRDLPATVVDLLGISAASPFPGRSLAAYWKQPPSNAGSSDLTSPAFSERAAEVVFQSPAGDDRKRDGVEMSVAAPGYHYIRNGRGVERLFDLKVDPFEQQDLMQPAPDHAQAGSVSQDAPRRSDRSAGFTRGRETPTWRVIGVGWNNLFMGNLHSRSPPVVNSCRMLKYASEKIDLDTCNRNGVDSVREV